MSSYLKSGELSERAIHTTVMEWVRHHPYIKKLVIHFPNEGKRTPRYGKMLKDLGMRKGVSDLLITMQKHGYGGAWIELKSKDGVLSKEQKEFLADMKAQNYYTAVTWSLDEALDTISWYCFGKTHEEPIRMV